jgi:predicted PurR-regulated permease PerM
MTLKLRLPDFSSRRTRRVILVIAVLIVVAGVLYAARAALLPFIVGLVLAYLLLPLVDFLHRLLPSWLRRRRMSRPLAILMVYLLAAGLLAALIAFFVPLIADQWRALWAQRDELTARGSILTQNLLSQYRENVPPAWRASIEASLSNTGASLMQSIPQSVLATYGAVTNVFTLILGFAVIPFALLSAQ